jgi:tetratricopeptide (TPR) repeat protein
MRPMQDLGELLTEADRLDESIAVYERMLGLNPGDNQGIRYALLGLYLAAWRGEQAAELMRRYPGEEDHAATFAWGACPPALAGGLRGRCPIGVVARQARESPSRRVI